MPKDFYESEPEPLSHSRDRRLPALHDVLGDVLGQPLRSSRSSPPEYNTRRSPLYQQQLYDHSYQHDTRQRGPPLAPLAHVQHPQKSRSSNASTATAQSPVDLQQQHAYHLFNYSPNQGLVHQRTSTQEQDLEPTHPRPRLPPSDPSRKYVCPDCGNRFSKHSTLRNHLLTHSGEKPFECTFAGCGRRFSMACNMQRHLRTHTSASAFDYDDRSPPTQPSSRGGSRASSWEGGSPRDPDPGHYSYSHRR